MSSLHALPHYARAVADMSFLTTHTNDTPPAKSDPIKLQPDANTMTNASFRYEPLNDASSNIRVLHLSSVLSSDGIIQCTLVHATTSTRYACLSYRWGEEGAQQQNSISINGTNFTVRDNLFQFLSTMRTTAPPEHAIFDPLMGYWIDAISINQNDGSEKNRQVARMGPIYEQAEYVHVWLGTAPNIGLIRSLLRPT